MPLTFLACFALVAVVTLGLSWPLVSRLSLTPLEKLVAVCVLSLVAVFLWSGIVYVAALPTKFLWGLPALAATGLVFGGRQLAAAFRDRDARTTITGQLLVSGWCLGWLAFVVTYSGGGWALDWFEHWERSRFFLEHWRHDYRFLSFYSAPARPPLTNIVTGAFLALNRIDFASFQFITTLLSSFVFLPAALLVRRFGGGTRSITVLGVILMLNPLFLQNATFAWTKLPAAFFVLAGLYFFLRAGDEDAPRVAPALFAASLGAGMLSHYSSGPYVVVLTSAWFIRGKPRWRQPEWRRSTMLAGAVGALVLAPWLSWSVAKYGVRETFFSNTTAIVHDRDVFAQLTRIALNIRDTLIPHFLRPIDSALLAQSSHWGLWRDWFFELYQVNLLFAFGSIGWLALGAALAKKLRRERSHFFWGASVACVMLIGIAATSIRDVWGLAHICLQSLVLTGLAFLAAQWDALGRGWRIALAVGATMDFVAGIAFHFAVENYALDRWFPQGRTPDEIMLSYTEAGRVNIAAKVQNHLSFFADVFTPHPALLIALLAALLVLALRRATRID